MTISREASQSVLQSGRASKTSQGFFNKFSSLKDLRAKTNALRENTMKRRDGMGFKAPAAWRDELYRNELVKLDIKKEI